MTETRVGHTRLDSTDVYAGRGPDGAHLLTTEIGDRGWLGNPYPADERGREAAIGMFAIEFLARVRTRPRFAAAVEDLAGKTLGCWCQRLDEEEPKCHAQVIALTADSLAGGEDGD